MNKKAIFLSMLCVVPLVSFDATAFPNFKSVVNVLRSRPVRYVAGVAGMALAGYVGWKMYRWFRPAQQIPVIELQDVIEPTENSEKTNATSSSSTNAAGTLRGILRTPSASTQPAEGTGSSRKVHATFAARGRGSRPTVLRHTKSEMSFDKARVAREAFINRADLKLNLSSAVQRRLDDAKTKDLDRIYNAVSSGIIENVKSAFLSAGISLNAPSYARTMALHGAVQNNHLRVFKFFVESKSVDINSSDDSGNTPLHFANSPEIIEYLLDKGAQVVQDDSGRTIFHRAVSRPELMHVLISKCPTFFQIELNKHDILGYTPLMWAFHTQDIDYIRGLLTALSRKCCNLAMQISQIDQKAQSGYSLLQLAVFLGNLELVQLLVEEFNFKDCINYQSKDTHETALHNALRFKHYQIAQYLIDNGARFDILDRKNIVAQSISGFNELDLSKRLPAEYEPPIILSDDSDDSDDDAGSPDQAGQSNTALLRQLAQGDEDDSGTIVQH